jgi:hypothetical protein
VPPPTPSIGRKGRSIVRISSGQAARDAANRALGKAGEDFVVKLEQLRLDGRKDLAAKVRCDAEQLGDGLGYDIRSFADDGSQLFIEVKTTNGSINTPFYVTENERRVASIKGAMLCIYRLFFFGTDPKVYGPLEDSLTLEPVVYRARAKTRQVSKQL